jgi:hypothetical protein
VKLHAELTYLLGAAAGAGADATEAAYAAAWPALRGPLVWGLAAAFALLGVCGGLAAAADAARLLLLPAELAHAVAAGLYRLHLRCMGAMWRLMRGRGAADGPAEAAARLRLRRAGRRGRGAAAAAPPPPRAPPLWGDAGEGAQEVTAEHVIVGVLLFTPLLALLPTTLAWYLLAALLHWGLAAARAALLASAALATGNPVCALARRALRPAAYPGGLRGGGSATARVPAARRPRRLGRGRGLAVFLGQHGYAPAPPPPPPPRPVPAGDLCVEALAPSGESPDADPGPGQRCFLLGYRSLGYGQVLAAAWAAPARGGGAAGRPAGERGGALAWLRTVAAGRSPIA